MNEQQAKKYVKLLTEFQFITICKSDPKRKYVWVEFLKFFKPTNDMIPVAHKAFFFDTYSDGEAECLFWAREWRDETYYWLLLENKMPPPTLNAKKGLYVNPPSNNKSGKCGVQRYDCTCLRKRPNGTTFYRHDLGYIATWVEYVSGQNNLVIKRQMKRYFSIKKYGDDEAYKLACEVRDEIEPRLNSGVHLALRDKWKLQKVNRQ